MERESGSTWTERGGEMEEEEQEETEEFLVTSASFTLWLLTDIVRLITLHLFWGVPIESQVIHIFISL